MIELITAIALLCQVKPIKLMSAKEVDQYQLDCQQEYLICSAKEGLRNCVLRRVIKKETK